MPEPFAYVDTEPELSIAIEAVHRAPFVGFDTEFVGEGSYEPQLCLVQVATSEGVWVIDPLGSIDLAPFWQELTAPGHEVIAVALRQELLFCLRYADRPPETFFDPQIAAGLLGYSYPMSHTNLLQQVLGVRVDGGETFTDWRKRPLSERQVVYAADDVRHLIALRERLLAGAEALGRNAWVRDECARAVQRIVQSESEERWWRVNGASGLSRRDLAVLRSLWTWRDGRARTLNQPPRRVLSDDLLIAITKRKPRSVQDLFALRGLERSSLRSEGLAVVAAVAAGLSVPEVALPASLRQDDPRQLPLLVQFASLVTNSLAAQHRVDPAQLATVADLQELVRWQLGGAKGEAPGVLLGWRGEILGGPLLGLLAGKTSVRIADATSLSPIVIDGT